MPNPIDATEAQQDDAVRPLHLQRIDVRAAVIVGGVFCSILGFAFLLAGWFVIAVAAQRGVLEQINSLTSELGSGGSTQVGALRLGLVWTAIVIGWTVAMTAVVGFGATILNAVLRLTGGIELDLSPTKPARAEVLTTAGARLAPAGRRVASAASRTGSKTVERLRQIDWSMLNLPGLAKPAHDGVDLRRSKAARARSAVERRDKDDNKVSPG